MGHLSTFELVWSIVAATLMVGFLAVLGAVIVDSIESKLKLGRYRPSQDPVTEEEPTPFEREMQRVLGAESDCLLGRTVSAFANQQPSVVRSRELTRTDYLT